METENKYPFYPMPLNLIGDIDKLSGVAVIVTIDESTGLQCITVVNNETGSSFI